VSSKPGAGHFTPSDIEKGARWDNEISKELEQSQFGIFVMTQDALSSSWIMFEAGAISKVVEKARVCPIVFGIDKTDLVGPLAGFQAIEFTEDEVRQLLKTINNAAKDAGLAERNLDTAFHKWWPDLVQKVKAISSTDLQPSRPHRSPDDLLRENLELTRTLVTEHQKLIQILTQSGLTDVEAVVRALRREANKQTIRGEPEDKAAFGAWLSDSLTAKSE
jgi:hypothetical protein